MQLRPLFEPLIDPGSMNPAVIYQQKLVFRDQAFRHRSVDMDLSWTVRMLKQWSNGPQSSLLLLKNTWERRFQVQYLVVPLVELLKTSDVPVIWVLEPRKDSLEASRPQISTGELLKSLISKVLQLPSVQVTEALGARLCAQFRGLKSETELLMLFGSIVSQIRALYVVIDAGVLEDRKIPTALPRKFNDIFLELSSRGIGTRLKVFMATRITEPYVLYDSARDTPIYVPVLRARPQPSARRGDRLRGHRTWRGRLAKAF
ncbi:hypothetical protein SCUP515_00933 [Seiridium cupressi]